jgi:hypothetical protein
MSSPLAWESWGLHGASPLSHLSLLLPVAQELLQVPVTVLLLQPTQAQSW